MEMKFDGCFFTPEETKQVSLKHGKLFLTFRKSHEILIGKVFTIFVPLIYRFPVQLSSLILSFACITFPLLFLQQFPFRTIPSRTSRLPLVLNWFEAKLSNKSNVRFGPIWSLWMFYNKVKVKYLFSHHHSYHPSTNIAKQIMEVWREPANIKKRKVPPNPSHFSYIRIAWWRENVKSHPRLNRMKKYSHAHNANRRNLFCSAEPVFYRERKKKETGRKNLQAHAAIVSWLRLQPSSTSSSSKISITIHFNDKIIFPCFSH